MGRLSELWVGMSPCMEPGIKGCVVWWDAWAAVGAWAAAAATFVAVIVPLIIASRKERLRNELELVDFVYSLPPFLAQWRRSVDVLEHIAESEGRTDASQLDMLRLAISVPPIEPSLRMRDVLTRFRLLTRDLATWNQFLEEARNELARVNEAEPWEVNWAGRSMLARVEFLKHHAMQINGHLIQVLDAVAEQAPSVRREVLFARSRLDSSIFN